MNLADIKKYFVILIPKKLKKFLKESINELKINHPKEKVQGMF